MYLKSSELWPRGKAPAEAYCGEDERLSVLAAHGTGALVDDPELQRIVDFTAKLCGAPVAMVSLVDRDRQHFLARLGIDARETPRPTSFCAHAMLESEPMVVPDASLDQRFADNPLVTGDPGVRFYAGHPLVSAEGAPLGSLCVIDTVPRDGGLNEIQREGLAVMAEAVMRRLSQERLDQEAHTEIARREQRLQLMIDSVPGIAWSADDEGNLDYVNARWTETTGAPIPMSAAEWSSYIHPEDRDSSLARWIEAMRKGEPHEDELRIRQKDGSYRWVLSRALPVREKGDTRQRWFGTVIDVDKAKRVSEARDLLANELSHRIKNIFAVVSGLIALRSRGRPEVKDFATEITNAIRALGTAHDYVRPDDGRSSDSLQGLLKDLLAPYDVAGGKRVCISGDDIEIGPRAATPLALIFHELATNAAKYGALSADEGRVDIEIIKTCGEKDEFCVNWRESSVEYNGEAQRPEDEGFGSRLLRMAIEGQLGGSFQRVFSDDGLDVEITVPTQQITR